MPGPIKVLFICTGNCCRSQMAEALLRHLGGDRFEAFSAGSNPAGYVHPLAIETMRRMGISVEGQHSKSWEEFADRPMDVIITLCDSAASRLCPQWLNGPTTAHWSLRDPSFGPGTQEDRLALAAEVAGELRGWIEQLISLPLAEVGPQERAIAVRRIAEG